MMPGMESVIPESLIMIPESVITIVRNTHLERTVAFKVLPEHVADDAQRRERRARSENGERLKPPSHLHAPRHRRTGREP